MSSTEQIETLRERHASLEQMLDEETRRPLPSQETMHDLKRQKLKIKDELSLLEGV